MSIAQFDTPITRASIENLPIEELNKFIAHLQQRRLRSYTIYQAAQEAKHEKQLNNTQELLDKRIGQFAKKLISVDKGLKDLETYAVDILTARMALGHDVTQK